MKKRLTIILLTLIFVLAAIVNKIVSERSVQQLGQTFSEIYDDRLLAESYIYQLNDLFYKKKITLLDPEIHGHSPIYKDEIQKQTAEIIEVARKYSLTKLTESERQIFEALKGNVTRLQIAETKLFSRQPRNPQELIRFCEVSVSQLHLLSSIQVLEGSLLKENSRKVLSSSNLAAQLEWAVFIIILLLFVTILPKRKIFEDIFPKHQLN